MSADPAWARARALRGRREHATRTALLASARDVFAASGYASATVDAIVAGAEVSHATFYLYFRSKADVLSAVAGDVRDEMLAVHTLEGVDDADPVELGRASSWAFLAAYTRNLDLLTVIEHQALADAGIALIWREIRDRPRRRMLRYVQRLEAADLADPAADPDAVAEAVLGMFVQFARRRISAPDRFAEATEQLNAMYLRLLGIVVTPPAPPSEPRLPNRKALA